MSDTTEKKLELIEQETAEVPAEIKSESKHQTNPIVQKLLKFHQENKKNFSVVDLFKNRTP